MILAIQEFTIHAPHRTSMRRRAQHLEQIARAAFGGRGSAATTLVEAATDLLSCDTAVLLRPTENEDTLVATHASDGAEAAAHELWRLGARAPQFFERSSHTADGWREPWAGLRVKLQALNVRSWAAVPLCNEGRTRPLGLLVIGTREAGERPCDRLGQVGDLALSATAALAVAAEIDGARTGASRAMHHLRICGNLTCGVSHTLGNILGAIIGNLHFLREETATESARELIERIERSTTDGMELMRSLQTYTASSAGQGMASLDLSEIAREVTELARRLTGHWPDHRRVRTEAELTKTAPAWADIRQVRESVVNLIFNALRAVGREGRVIVRTACDERFSEVRVIDDGPGMTNEVRRRAAEPFFTTDPTVHQGLGLTVARGVAVGHRGTLTLHHAQSRGTEVALRLPQEPPAQETGRTDRSRGAASQVAGH